jgi:hypothetical protein
MTEVTVSAKATIHVEHSSIKVIENQSGDSWSNIVHRTEYSFCLGQGQIFTVGDNDIRLAKIKHIAQYAWGYGPPPNSTRLVCKLYKSKDMWLSDYITSAYNTYETDDIERADGGNTPNYTNLWFHFSDDVILEAGGQYAYHIETVEMFENETILEGLTDSGNHYAGGRIIRKVLYPPYEDINEQRISTLSYDCHFELYSYTISKISARARIVLDTDPGRKTKLSFGYGSEYISNFVGYSDYPKIEQRNKSAKFHFYDALEYLSQFKLSGGSLLTDIKVSSYVWKILDEAYEDYFLEIASGDSGESWLDSGDGTVSSDTDNHIEGDACAKLTVEDGTGSAYIDTGNLDITDYNYLSFYIFIEDAEYVDEAFVRFETTHGSDYFEYELTNLKSGWNIFYVSKDDFDETGSPDWDDVDSFELELTTTEGDTTYAFIDAVRAVDSVNYPFRYFSNSLQIIPTAWFAGNTALYEIKVACEAEGARFFSDENGNLYFQNRQFYNLTDSYKVSSWEFNFNRLFDHELPMRENEIINKVLVKIKPRVIVSEKEIWNYSFTPSIEASETKTVWAEFTDPCPTTAAGIVEPVATTDYTANTQEDGEGDDKTAQIDIDITKFATSAKLEITNNDAGTVYLTMLKLRGTPAEEASEVRVIVEDNDSIESFGTRPSGGYIIDNKYLADETYAGTLAQQLIDWYKDPLSRVVLKNRSVPHLQLGDMISVKNDELNTSKLMRITTLKNSYTTDGFNQEIHARDVATFELLSFFTIGDSEIESVDVIAP